jgi:hypothetical protein
MTKEGVGWTGDEGGADGGEANGGGGWHYKGLAVCFDKNLTKYC